MRPRGERWSPPGWFDDAAFDAVAESFENPDWADVTLHSYGVRWGEARPYLRYAVLEVAQKSARTILVPTVLIRGDSDRVNLPPPEDESSYLRVRISATFSKTSDTFRRVKPQMLGHRFSLTF